MAFGFSSIPRFTPSFASPDLKDPAGSYSSAFNAYAQTTSNMIGAGFNMLDAALADRQQRNRGLWAAYGKLNRQVQGKLAGSNRANLEDLSQQFTALSGQMSQQMIDSGLGNTTVQQAMQIGLGGEYAREKTRSEGLFAQLQADAMQRVMGQGLQARERGINAIQDIRMGGLNFLSSMTPMAPDPGVWAQLAMAGMGNGFEMGLPGMPGQSAPVGPVGGAIPQGLFSASFQMEPGGGGGGGGAVDPSFYGYASMGAPQPQRQSYLPGYEMGASGMGPYVPPGSYPQVEATYG
jgi:hypothetical protein